MAHDGREFFSTHSAPLIGGEQTDLTKAAAYVRMSTEHQQYSTSNQMDVIQEYAQRRGHEIVKVYSDEGKSGLNIQGRDSLAQMIRDVQAGETEFCILVYDVSRWGRFQDADESAFYEHICRKAGVTVHYCAEQFENDGSPVSTIVKGVKRAMAGEYSRELSSKVFQGACRLIQRGFRQGGTAGYGLRRMLVDQNGEKKAALKFGEQKSLQTDRVILVPGPEEEVKVVKWIYRMFIEEGKKESDILVAVTKEERMLRSLVENIARRTPSPLVLMTEIERLKEQGYSNRQIGTKLDMSEHMVAGYIALKQAGEQRLLDAAVSGRIPLGVAMEIAQAITPEMQRELLTAYEKKELNKFSIRTVKRIIEQRRFIGKGRDSSPGTQNTKTSAESLVCTYKT